MITLKVIYINKSNAQRYHNKTIYSNNKNKYNKNKQEPKKTPIYFIIF